MTANRSPAALPAPEYHRFYRLGAAAGWLTAAPVLAVTVIFTMDAQPNTKEKWETPRGIMCDA